MVPSGALIFKLEQTFFGLDVDYTQVYELMRREAPAEARRLLTPGLSSSLLSLRRTMKKKAYEELRTKAEAMARTAESRALLAAQMHPGVVSMLEQVRDTGWWVVAASDLGKKAVAEFLQKESLDQYMNLVVARSRLDEDGTLERRLKPVKVKLMTLANSVYFCNSSKEVKEAKGLGMKCFVLPSHVEPFRTLYQAGPNGILLSLEEVPPLLQLPSMKLPPPLKLEVASGPGQKGETAPRRIRNLSKRVRPKSNRGS